MDNSNNNGSNNSNKSLVAVEDVAFDVDRSRMIKVLQKSRLADRYAYIRNILALAVETKARKVTVRGTPWKIVIADNGEGLPYHTLDEKLANIFTEEEADDLTTGILSSFQAGVREVTIETVPEHEEPYALTISYDGEEVSVSEPEPLERALKKGTRLVLQKKQLLETSSWRDWWQSLKSVVGSGGVPELARIRESYAYSNLEIRVNFRTVEKKWETPRCLVEIPVDQDGIRGRVGLLKEHKLEHDPHRSYDETMPANCTSWASSPIHLYRKGLFQGLFHYRREDIFTVPFGPIFAELNYDKLQVDISGKQLVKDNEKMQKIATVLHGVTAALYAELLEKVPAKDQARKAHLQFYSALHLRALTHHWKKKQEGMWRTDLSAFYCPAGLYRANTGTIPGTIPVSIMTPTLAEKCLEEKLYKIKDQDEEVSLSFILEHLAAGKPVIVDHRGFDYREVPKEALVVSVKEQRDLAGLVLQTFHSNKQNLKILYPERAGTAWLYHRLESPEAIELKEKRNSLQEKLRVPLLYRPAQAVAAYYDFFIRPFVEEGGIFGDVQGTQGNEGASSRRRKSDSPVFDALGNLATFIFSQAMLLPMCGSMMMGGSLLIGLGETLYRPALAGIRMSNIALEDWLQQRRRLSSAPETHLLTDGSAEAEAEEGGLEKALTKVEAGTSLLRRGGRAVGYYGSLVLGYVGWAAGRALRTAGHYSALGLGYGGKATGRALQVAGGYGSVGLGYTGKALRVTGKALLVAGGVAGVAALGVAAVAGTVVGGIIATPFVLGYKGVKALSERYSPTLRAYFEQWEQEKARRKALRLEKRNLQGLLKAPEGRRSISRRKERQEQQWEKFQILLSGTFNSSPLFREYHHHFLEYSDGDGIPRLEDETRSRFSYEWHIPIFRTKERPMQVTIAAKDRRIRKLVEIVGEARQVNQGEENFTPYLASAIIDTCSLSKRKVEDPDPPYKTKALMPTTFEVAAFMEKYHTSVLERRMNEHVQQAISYYQQGQAQEFLQQYARLDQQRKIAVLYGVLGEERQLVIDAALEAQPDNIPLLDEAGRKRVQEREQKAKQEKVGRERAEKEQSRISSGSRDGSEAAYALGASLYSNMEGDYSSKRYSPLERQIISTDSYLLKKRDGGK